MNPSRTNSKRARPALGTIVVLSLDGVASEQADLFFAQAFSELTRLEKIFNFFDDSSELSHLNRTSGALFEVSPELADVLRMGEQIEKISQGAFRLMPTCPHSVDECFSWLGKNQIIKTSCAFDLGGIAKGAIVDHVFHFLKGLAPEAGVTVNAGGDLRSSTPQSVEIRVPGKSGERRFETPVFEGAIATSSVNADDLNVGKGSARFSTSSHDQALAFKSRSAMVIAETCLVADAWTKVALFSNQVNSELGADLGVLAQCRFDDEGLLLGGDTSV